MITVKQGIAFKLFLLLTLAFFVRLVSPSGVARAQEPWPPFWFDLIPSFENGQITYQVNVYSRVDWPLSDLTLKIPLPEGSRFLQAEAPPTVKTDFDGQEITFFAPAFEQYQEASFTVAVTDSTQTIFTTHGWLTWKGEHPGDYLAEEVSIDTTRQPLPRYVPPRFRLQLGLGAVVFSDTITYTIYPKGVDRYRMWDVKINIPLPQGTTFLSADAPPSFTTGFNGREVAFSTLELERQAEVSPLTFRISTAGFADAVISTSVWAAWKNGPTASPPANQVKPVQSGGEGIRPVIPAAEEFAVDMSVSRPHTPQQVVFDMRGDVPFGGYDLTSIAFQETSSVPTVIFNLAGDVGAVGQPLVYNLFIDSDCNATTGQRQNYRGVEYRVRYDRHRDRTTLVSWDTAANDWNWSGETDLNSWVEGTSVMVSLPHGSIGTGPQFCWLASTSNKIQAFNPNPPDDRVPNEQFLALTQYKTVPGSTLEVNGKLAIPLLNERNVYDVHIFSLPGGQEITRIPSARQPNFAADGQSLWLNHDQGSAENVQEYQLADGRTITSVLKSYNTPAGIYEYNLVNGTEKQVNQASTASPLLDGFQGNQVGNIPTDAKAGLIAFMSPRAGNWEAYVMNPDGVNVRNLSQNPKADDGLPAISPDGNWIAFVSDRTGSWAVWLTPVAGGPAQKLFDLPGDTPWGQGNRAWADERMSWGP